MSLSVLKRKIDTEMKRQGLNPASLARKAGLGKTAVRDLLDNQDQDPRIGTLFKVCEALDIPLASLFADNIVSGNGSVLVPELDVRASAGHGAVVESEDTKNTWAIPRGYLEAMTFSKLEFLKIIQVQGDSMLPDYRPGDRILVDTSDRRPSDGDFVILDGFGNLLVKKLQVVAGTNPPRLRIISANKIYETYELPPDDIHINGRVIGKWDWR